MLEHMTETADDAVDIIVVAKGDLGSWLEAQPLAKTWGAWLKAVKFKAEVGDLCPLPDEHGNPKGFLVGLGDESDGWALASLPSRLPLGTYRLVSQLDAHQSQWAAVSWMLGTYQFGRYKQKPTKEWPKLVWPQDCDQSKVASLAEAIGLVRDLINVPAEDMGPAELALEAKKLAERFGATYGETVGEDLLTQGYPAVYAVGKAAALGREPRLIDLVWGDPAHPKITLVGKGVCFDSGGLDLKNASGMKLMKKDMGGAAHVLGLASLIMSQKVGVRLRVLIPAVENAVSGNAMRPLDVLKTRKGVTVEIGNTDAEGRLILADALWEGASEKPELLIDFATLTGAARTALGTDIAALFSNNNALADKLCAASEAENDPLWRLPLHKPYRRMIESKVADLCNATDSPYAGAITAALFLQEFVPPSVAWAHFDVMAWNTSSRPGRPEGGEALALRSVFAVISQSSVKN